MSARYIVTRKGRVGVWHVVDTMTREIVDAWGDEQSALKACVKFNDGTHKRSQVLRTADMDAQR